MGVIINGLTIMPGVLELIESAALGKRNANALYAFNRGDLGQMAAIKKFLSENGIVIEMNNVYPCVEKKEDFLKGLRLIWQTKCEGWWNFDEEFISNEICSPEEYANAMSFSPEVRKNFLLRYATKK